MPKEIKITELAPEASALILAKQSFISESSSIAREQTKTNCIIFLGIVHVIYQGSVHDKQHLRRLDNNLLQEIVLLPEIHEKIPASLLKTLNKSDLSAALGFSKPALENAKKLCITHHAKLVVTSEWCINRTLEEIKAYFSLYDMADYVVDIISPSRGKEEKINKWILNNARSLKSYVILSSRDYKLTNYFGPRFVECPRLLTDETVYQNASLMLGTPLNSEVNQVVLRWDNFQNSAHLLNKIEFSLQDFVNLQTYFYENITTLLTRFFDLLIQNKTISHLTLHGFHEKKWGDLLLDLLLNALNQGLTLDYLSLSDCGLRNLDPLLTTLNDQNKHIPHLCFNKNPITDHVQLTEWLSKYTSPLRIELDFASVYFGSHHLTPNNLQQILANDMITISTAIDDGYKDEPWIQGKINSGQLHLTQDSRHTCCIS